MKNPIQAMLEAGVAEATAFPPESRYHGIPTKQVSLSDTRTVTCLQRRLAPRAAFFATRGYRTVSEGERLDHVAADTIGDPLGFWMLCDSNGAIWPEELETVGRSVRLTLPAGVPGDEDAM